MADARGRMEWEQTSAQMALIVNLLRDQKKSKPAKASDFNPYHIKPQKIAHAPLTILRDVFVKK